MLSVGLVGCGAVAHANYAKTLRGRGEYAVRFVTDIVPAHAASAAQLFEAHATTFDDLVSRADAIVVTTPPDTHAELVRACLRPGKIVLCEKPFAVSRREALELADRADAAGAHLSVGHFRRTFPQLEVARALVERGAIGAVTGLTMSEGGRFTWQTATDYIVSHPHGGVLWDTGSHTLDMALFAACLDGWPDCRVETIEIARDKAEPSHDFRARFAIDGGAGGRVDGRIHVSRKDVLPNVITIAGDRGSLMFSVGLDHRVRQTTAAGSTVVEADVQYADLLECFDLQLRRILLRDRDGDFAARRFLALTRILETLADG